MGAFDSLTPFTSLWLLKFRFKELSFALSFSKSCERSFRLYLHLRAHGASLGLTTILKGATYSISWVLLVYHQWDLQVRDNSANRKAWVPWAEKWYPLMSGYIWCVHFVWRCYWASLLYKLCRAVLEPIYTAVSQAATSQHTASHAEPDQHTSSPVALCNYWGKSCSRPRPLKDSRWRTCHQADFKAHGCLSHTGFYKLRLLPWYWRI